ncbi:MAG: triose-phosphate isomerase [Firmicutes bacterium]|nr:triose-phosphate isomerase [Bacillota bacterium]
MEEKTTGRTPLIAGNWKMNLQVTQAVDLVEKLVAKDVVGHGVEVLVCPPFTALYAVSRVVNPAGIKLGAQNMHWEEAGAFTGEIAPGMLAEIGCQYVIIGHSERRQYFGETDATVNKKVKAALINRLTPIICVGETLEQREEGLTDRLIRDQVKAALLGLDPEDVLKVVFAYEPIWAIGTGKTAEGCEANRVCRLIRETVGEINAEASSWVRILYGGSVKPTNYADFAAQPDIDGALVGGASLQAEQFAEIVRVAAE